MLKNRGKAFAPKAPKARPHGPASARPSVERSSQTPAPREPSVIPVEKELAPESIPEKELPERTEPQTPAARETIPVEKEVAETARPENRKATAAVAIEPPPTRIATNVEKESVPEANPPVRAAMSSESRKRSAGDNIQPPAKRVANVEPTTASESTKQIIPAAVGPTQRIVPPVTRRPLPSTPAAKPKTISAANNDSHLTQRAESSAPVTTQKAEDDEESLPSRPPTPEPRNRYPSPVNLVHVVDDIPGDRMGSMGPAGGGASAFGVPGDLGAAGARVMLESELVPMAALNPDGTSGGLIEEAPSGTDTEAGKKGKKKSTRRRGKGKKVQAPEIGDDGRATIEMQLNRPRAKGPKKSRKKKEPKDRKQRAETPEGADAEEIDKSKMTMTELCKDLKIGKPFSFHKDIKIRLEQKKKAQEDIRLRRKNPLLGAMIDANNAAADEEAARAGANGGVGEAGPSQPDEIEPMRPGAPGLQMRLLNGNIVLDERSMQIDRQKNAQAKQSEYQVVEENDFTRVFTSGTHMKMERAMPWDAAANELFYTCLRRHGTDFETIAQYFPHRNRRMIKLKFNKEERNFPSKINRALMGVKEPIDMEEHATISKVKLEQVADIQKELEAYDAEKQAEVDKRDAAVAEDERQKRAKNQSLDPNKAAQEKAKRILAEEASDGEGDESGRAGESAKENRSPARARYQSPEPVTGKGKKKAAPKKKKNKHSHYAGGEEVEVLGTVA